MAAGNRVGGNGVGRAGPEDFDAVGGDGFPRLEIAGGTHSAALHDDSVPLVFLYLFQTSAKCEFQFPGTVDHFALTDWIHGELVVRTVAVVVVREMLLDKACT